METFDLAVLYKGNLAWIPDRTILLIKSGSHAYGLNTPESDLDIKGIAIPPREYFLGWLNRFDQTEQEKPDLVIYGIHKFFALAADGNPNIIEVLWGDASDILMFHSASEMLLDNRTAFLSQKVRHTFSGYAHAQLKRIMTHKKWLLDPPTHKPERAEFELPETSLISADIMGAIQSLTEKSDDADKTVDERFGPQVMHAYQRERAYHNAMVHWQQYQTWKKNRNPARAANEQQFGYDTKHAMHLVRLMRMCREILTTGIVQVKRQDREELLEIRRGAWSYDKLIEWAKVEDEAMADLQANSPLPHSPDRNSLNNLCIKIVESFL